MPLWAHARAWAQRAVARRSAWRAAALRPASHAEAGLHDSLACTCCVRVKRAPRCHSDVVVPVYDGC